MARPRSAVALPPAALLAVGCSGGQAALSRRRLSRVPRRRPHAPRVAVVVGITPVAERDEALALFRESAMTYRPRDQEEVG